MKKMILSIICALTPISLVHASDLSENSIYQIASVWQDQNAKDFRLESLQGNLVIIGMLYTSCPHACPMIISKVQEIEKAIKTKGVDHYQIVMASFDPKVDTPANLKKFMKQRKLNEEKWTLLSAKDDSVVRDLAVVLGINYKAVGGGDFSHSNIITLLDKKGEIRAKVDKLSGDINTIVNVANSLK